MAKRSDQIAVMVYDTGAYLPRVYVSLMAREVAEVSRAVEAANPRCGVLIGVPTYGPGLISHNPRAENLELALRGVREGLLNPETKRGAVSGVALFADYTTDDSEWDAFARLWTRPSN